MKKRLKVQMMILALAVLSSTLLGCGEKKGTDGENSALETTKQEEGDGDVDASGEDASGDREETDGETPDSKSSNEEADHEEEPKASDQSAEDSIIGDIQELGDGKFVISKAEQWTEDGVDILADPAPGAEEADLNLMTILYDESTVFKRRIIRDGGASYEDQDCSSKELEKEMMVEIWGDYEGDDFRASEIQVIEVILQ